MTDKSSGTSWPQGKRSAAIISVIFADGLDAIAEAPDLANRSKSLSVWQFGARRGVERLCESFEEGNIKTSWFVPGVVAERHDQLLRAVGALGHELESHGWNFERYEHLGDQQVFDLLKRSRDAIEAVTARKPTGFRLPAGNWPSHFDRILLEAGFFWSASLNGDDVPYTHRSGLIEVPVHIELEDRPYFQFNFTPAFPKGLGRIPSYEGVLANWIAEFEAYRKYGLCYVLQLRPEWTGTPGRIALVDELLRHIRGYDDVWLATARDVAQWQSDRRETTPEDHPINVYERYTIEERSNG